MDCFKFLLGFLILGLTRSQSITFHRTFSDECASNKIESVDDCSSDSGRNAWSSEKRTAESDTKFVTSTGKVGAETKKCYSKVLVFTQYCNSVRSCIMTTYKYFLPKPKSPIIPGTCTRDWSIETSCKANGPGGMNTKAVYVNCFPKGPRNICGVEFAKCEPQSCFQWNGYKKSCYTSCVTPRFDGIALEFRRTCKECDGKETDVSNCPGGEDSSTRLGRCMRSVSVRKFPDCNHAETTTTNTVTDTTTILTTIPTTAKTTKKTIPIVQTRKPTTEQTPVKPKVTTVKTTTTTTKKATKTTTKTTTTEKTNPSTPKPKTTVVTSTVKKAIFTERSNIARNFPRLPIGNMITDTVPRDETTQVPGIADSDHRVRDVEAFDIATIAGGIGAGVIFLILILLLIVILRKRATPNKAPSRTYSSSSLSLSRRRNPKNPVVDSSSFRFSTWSRERPALPNLSPVSSESESGTANYWNIGISQDEHEVHSPTYVKSESPKIPDVVNVKSPKLSSPFTQDPVYDIVAEDDPKNIYESIKDPRKSPYANKARHVSVVSDNSDVLESSSQRRPRNDGAVYAVVRKTNKNGRGGKKAFRLSEENNRTTSIMSLNGQHLKDGVLTIEFDEIEGLRCKLADSNIYINLEETEPPPVQ